MVRLLHAADIHLGRRRLDGRLPDSDFAQAFVHLAEQAIAARADAVLLAGDLFDRAQVEPNHLRQAQDVLLRLKTARIPVIAIAGNHDRAFQHSDAPTWLDYLADDELLLLLAPRFGPSGAELNPWNPSTRRGSWIELKGVRFTGVGYLGAATPHKLRSVVEQLPPGSAHVLLLHAGPEYFVGEGGGFSKADLEAIRQRVTYLALGHIHRPMLYQGWACNPGSPENCELTESRYDIDRTGGPVARGYAWVEIDPTADPALKVLQIRSNPRRPVLHLTLDCTPFGNKLKDGAVAFVKAACRLIAEHAPSAEAAVVLQLTGRINLGRLALDLGLAALNIEQTANVRAVALDPSGINLDGPASETSPAGQSLCREEIERRSLRQLIQAEHLWGLDGEQDRLADMFYALKESVRVGRSVEELVEQVQLSPLVERIQSASTTSPLATSANPSPDGQPT